MTANPNMPCCPAPEESVLCRGDYQTEEQAREQLARFRASYPDLAGWQARAAVIREGILRGAGLSPLPKRGDLNPLGRGPRTHDGYTIENVAFESLPGFFVAGNLYRPANCQARRHAAVLCPHGHFDRPNGGGRFRDDMQKRCATLARMGAVVFAWDMVGWGESGQYPHNTGEKVLALQLWNSIRALDFLETLPEVDPVRVGITGASGGGTQAFLLAAVDERIRVSIPAVQVSAHFFGGCGCESGMPIHRSVRHQTSNVEIAALAAPRPQLLISDGQDWTRNTPVVEYPYIREVYRLYDAEAQVECAHFPDEGHDYGYSKRCPAYRFLARHLGLSLSAVQAADGSIDESAVTVESREMLLAFCPHHPMPGRALRSPEAVEGQLADSAAEARACLPAPAGMQGDGG